MKRIAIATLAVVNLWLVYRLGVRAGEAEGWHSAVLECLDTAEQTYAVLKQCMAVVETRKRCVCFEEPAYHPSSTGAQP